MIDTVQDEKTDMNSVYEVGMRLLKDSYNAKQIFASLPRPEMPLSFFEFLVLPALAPKQRKEVIKKYLHEDKILNISTTGTLAWAILNTLSDYNEAERLQLEKYFTKCEEYFDCKIDAEGLLATDNQDNWLKSAKREGILVENQAFHAKLLDILFLLTDDDLYEFKKKRLMRSVREKMDGAYVLDRVDCLEVRPNNFIAAFFAPELFMTSEWEETFDASLKMTELWMSWGGLRTLGQNDTNFNPERDSESWFFVNNMAAIVLQKLNREKYSSKIKKIIEASTENASWQEHTGRPCEVVLTADKQIKVQALNAISLATYIYLYRLKNSQK